MKDYSFEYKQFVHDIVALFTDFDYTIESKRIIDCKTGLDADGPDRAMFDYLLAQIENKHGFTI